MRLDDILYRFSSPREASEVAGTSRTAAYHWYASGNKRQIPPSRVVIRFVDHFGLSDADLGSIIRDCELLRGRRMVRKHRRKARPLVREESSVDWAAKERYLRTELAEEGDDLFDRLTNILKEHL